MAGPADIGLVGLAVMGQSLALNFAEHGFRVATYNRTPSVTDDYLSGPASGFSVAGFHALEDLVGGLAKPRKVMLMIKAGPAVDALLDQLLALLEPGDIVIDGGNSLYTDTMRRTARLEASGLLFIGAGISGGEEGARHGPSIMPGGSEAAWPSVKTMLQAIAAKTADGTPCCDWVGPNGAGHYVKMVHNGIEYGDMQVIAEAYHLMSESGMSHDQMSETFAAWGSGPLKSFLIEITSHILAQKDSDGGPLVEAILDSAGQKGTGKWTVISSMDLAQPVTLVSESVYARIVSSFKDERMAAHGLLGGPKTSLRLNPEEIRQALYASKVVSYAQGFMLLRAASDEYGWDLDYGRIAGLWREGCIIRAAFLDDITNAFGENRNLPNLMIAPFFREVLSEAQPGWRNTVAAAVTAGIPVPAYSSALSFYDSYRTERLPANLIQAQRDYFGAHTYERIDKPRGMFFHTNWTGHGGDVTAGSYQV